MHSGGRTGSARQFEQSRRSGTSSSSVSPRAAKRIPQRGADADVFRSRVLEKIIRMIIARGDLLDAVRYEKDAMAYRKTVDAMYSTLKRVSTMRVALKPIPRRRPPIKD